MSRSRLRLLAGIAALALASAAITIMAAAASSRTVHRSAARSQRGARPSQELLGRPACRRHVVARHGVGENRMPGERHRCHRLGLTRAGTERARMATARARTERARMALAVSAASPRPYETSVNPGSAIQFVSPTVGWRVDGIYAAPSLAGWPVNCLPVHPAPRLIGQELRLANRPTAAPVGP